MAFHWPTFRTRALTAIVFAAVMLTGLLWNEWSFLALFSIIHFGCWWEYLRLLEKIHRAEYHINLKAGLMLLGYGVMVYVPVASAVLSGGEPAIDLGRAGAGSVNLHFILLAAGTLLTMVGVMQQKKISFRIFISAVLGLLYISLSWGLMLGLYERIDVYGQNTMYAIGAGMMPVLIIASIWINDTMAYIVGSFIGKTPLSKVSPKKTWEGTIGGIILCIAVVGFVLPVWLFPGAGGLLMGFVAIVAAVSAIAGTFGDLLESKLKRMAGVKDSGHIMPGHGGFLDRFDSLLLATPAVCLLLLLVLRVLAG
ncbi:MAG TPA: phosphatidate cytidylyltransferase [Chitinophagaceae bacterium]|nr:phosphatidate cytidylyltransferase [Chitinophagaceae bacterium]